MSFAKYFLLVFVLSSHAFDKIFAEQKFLILVTSCLSTIYFMIMFLVFIRFTILKKHSGCNVKKSLEGDKMGIVIIECQYRYVGEFHRKTEHNIYLILLSCDQGEYDITCRALRQCHISWRPSILVSLVSLGILTEFGKKKAHLFPSGNLCLH